MDVFIDIQIANKIFARLIKTYHFELRIKSNSIDLVNDHCRIQISEEYGNLDFIFYKKKSKIGYSLKTMLLTLFRITWIVPKKSNSHIINQLEYANEIIHKYFSNVLKGDFSWVKLYNKIQKEIRELRKTAGFLPLNDPIKIKYLKDNPTWEDDLFERLKSISKIK